jgi:hypothetical protein
MIIINRKPDDFYAGRSMTAPRRLLLIVLMLALVISGCTETPLPDRKVETYRVYSALIQAKYVIGSTKQIVIAPKLIAE